MIKNILIVFILGAVAVLGFQYYQQQKLIREYADLKIKHEELLAANRERAQNGLGESRKDKEDLIKQLKQILGAQLSKQKPKKLKQMLETPISKQKPKKPPAVDRIRSVAKESTKTQK